MVHHRSSLPDPVTVRLGVQPKVQDHHLLTSQSGIPSATLEPIEPSPSLVQLLTVPEVAEILKLSCRTVRRLIEDKRLRVVHIGRAVRVHPDAVTALIGNSK
jgi:excisionase family DNA binding protein